MTNTRNTPVESLEHEYPLHVEWMRIRRGSGGRGTHRGGNGIERAIRVLAPSRVTVISDRRARGPYGLRGGDPGRPGETQVFDAAQPRRPRRMPGKFQIDLAANSVIAIASPGGGGFGSPRSARRGQRPK